MVGWWARGSSLPHPHGPLCLGSGCILCCLCGWWGMGSPDQHALCLGASVLVLSLSHLQLGGKMPAPEPGLERATCDCSRQRGASPLRLLSVAGCGGGKEKKGRRLLWGVPWAAKAQQGVCCCVVLSLSLCVYACRLCLPLQSHQGGRLQHTGHNNALCQPVALPLWARGRTCALDAY
jgi:hypothetical protein